jgi:hypothetical protein
MPGQAHEGVSASAQRLAKTGDLVQSASQQRGAGIHAQPEAITDAGGDCHDVLYRATDFSADDVIAGVDAQAWTAQIFGTTEREAGIGRRDRHHRRQVPCQFIGKAGAGENATPTLAEHFAHHLVGQQSGTSFQALAKPQEGRPDPRIAQVL